VAGEMTWNDPNTCGQKFGKNLYKNSYIFRKKKPYNLYFAVCPGLETIICFTFSLGFFIYLSDLCHSREKMQKKLGRYLNLFLIYKGF